MRKCKTCKLKVVETQKGKDVLAYVQLPNKGITYCGGKEDYSIYSQYFCELMNIAKQHLSNVCFILKVEEKGTILVLPICEAEKDKADIVKQALLEGMDGDIESITKKKTVAGIELGIMDIFS